MKAWVNTEAHPDTDVIESVPPPRGLPATHLHRPRLHVGGRRRAPLRRPQSPHTTYRWRIGTPRSAPVQLRARIPGRDHLPGDRSLRHDVAPRMRQQHRRIALHHRRCRPALSEPVGRFVPRPPTDHPSQRTSSTPRAWRPTTQRTRRVVGIEQVHSRKDRRTPELADWPSTVTDPRTTPQHHPPARSPVPRAGRTPPPPERHQHPGLRAVPSPARTPRQMTVTSRRSRTDSGTPIYGCQTKYPPVGDRQGPQRARTDPRAARCRSAPRSEPSRHPRTWRDQRQHRSGPRPLPGFG